MRDTAASMCRGWCWCRGLYKGQGNHQKPCEWPPGGTRARSDEADPGLLASAPPPPNDEPFDDAVADPFWAGVDALSPPVVEDGAAVVRFDPSSVSFGSIVPITAFMLDEFCWLFFGRGGFCRTSVAPKMSEWPPPGGFSTRLDGFDSAATPTLKFVDDMMMITR